MTSASKFNIEPNGGIFDVSTENDRVPPNVKSPVFTDKRTENVGGWGVVAVPYPPVFLTPFCPSTEYQK